MKKKSPGEKRIEATIRLSKLVKEFALAGIKRQNPRANKKEIMNLWAKETSLPF